MMVSMLAAVRAARHLVWVAAFVGAFASTATCLLAVAAAEPKAACHGSEEHVPAGSALSENCCPADDAQTSSPAAAPVTAPPPSPVIVAVLSFDVEPLAKVLAAGVDSGTPSPPGTATYVLVSSFRI